MPVAPRTWTAGDPVSPTYLNGDLYSTDYGNALDPNGVLFHARKPLYLAASGTAVSAGPGVWTGVFDGQGTASVIQDSPGDYSAHLDPGQWGSVQSVLAAADGTEADTGGGWFLFSSTMPIGSASGNGKPFGSEIYQNGTLANVGQFSLAASGQPATPWIIDLFNTAPAANTPLVYTPAVFNGDTTTQTAKVNLAGTGSCVRFAALWASAASGTLPAAYPPAPKTVWSDGDQWTAAWANGPAGVRDVLRYLNMPPCLRADTGSGTTSCINSTATVVAVNTVQLDEWSGFSTSAHTWTCPADGIYLCYGLIAWTAAEGSYQASIRVNGTDYWGPNNRGGTTVGVTASKVQVFSLRAGDTVQLAGFQVSGGTLSTSSTSKCRLLAVWLASPGVPGVINSSPYFTSGTTGWAGTGGTVTIASPLPAGSPYPQVALLTPSGTVSQVTADGSPDPFPVAANAWYGVNAWVNPAGTSQAAYGFTWLNSGHSVISGTLTTRSLTAGAWVPVQTIAQAPGSAAFAYTQVGRFNGTASVLASNTTWIAGVQAAQAGSASPVPPNLANRYSAGTPGGSVPSVFTAGLGNDLTFLVQKPYLLAYQNTAQPGLSQTVPTQVNMQAVAGQVHGDYGDNYGGWSAANFWYAAPVSGWYLVVTEVLAVVNTSASNAMVSAQIEISTGSGADVYENHVVTSVSDSTIPGAAAAGLYYLRAGDTVFPLIGLTNYPAAPSTNVSAGHTSHLEVVWISE